jgi:hypothetical protein
MFPAHTPGKSDDGNLLSHLTVLFGLYIDMSFQDLTRTEVEDNEVHKCMNLMQRLAKNKSLNGVQKIQKLAYDIAQEFKLIYEES